MSTKYTAHYYTNVGRYNLLGDNKSWCLTLCTSGGNFSETWPEDDHPEVVGMKPTEVMELLRERLKSYLYKSSRDETLARMDAWMADGNQYDIAWLTAAIDRHEREATKLKRERQEILDEIADQESESTGEQA